MVQDILREHAPQCDVWAFGSRVRGDAKPASDLDLAVQGTAPLSIGALAKLAMAFEESDLPMKVDVVDMARIAKPLLMIIEKNKIPLQKEKN